MENIFEMLIISMFAASIVSILVLRIKNNNTFTQRMRVMFGITCYITNNAHSLKEGDVEKLFDSMESYDDTLYRLWDWGYKNIVSEDTYEKIKVYL